MIGKWVILGDMSRGFGVVVGALRALDRKITPPRCG